MSLFTKYFNIFASYTTFGRYIGIEATSETDFWPSNSVNIVAIKIQAFHYEVGGSPFKKRKKERKKGNLKK